MPGLLDGWGDFIKTPEGQGLLSAAFGGLAGARMGQPINSIGRAGLAGLSGYSGAEDRIDERAKNAGALEMNRIALAKAKREESQQSGLTGLQSQFFTPAVEASAGTGNVESNLPPEFRTGMAPMPAMPAMPSKFDVNGYTSAALNKGLMSPLQAIQLQQSMVKESGVDKLKPESYTPASLASYAKTRNFADLMPRDKLEFVEGVGVNPFDPKNANRSIPNPNKPFQMGLDGQPVANTAYQNYEIGKAKAGASNTSVKVEKDRKSVV